ncbi:uncharacterized protein RB166_000361 [Leptodactylus fuscus]
MRLNGHWWQTKAHQGQVAKDGIPAGPINVQVEIKLRLFCVALESIFLFHLVPYVPSSYENNHSSSTLCLWKKKKNTVFPASHHTVETWGKDAIPSTSRTSGISFRSDSEPCLSTVMLNSDLPGSTTNLFDELKSHPSCIIKSITIDNDSIESPGKQGESWFNKIGIYTSKLSAMSCWKGMKEETKQLDRDTHNFTNSCLNESQELVECQTNEGQAYIPYHFAKMYISKVSDDMQKMKLKYMDIIKEMDYNAKKQQEQISFNLRNHYHDKMKILKVRIQAYHDVMERKSQHFQDKIKALEMEKEQWTQEKSSLLLEINELEEKLVHEKVHYAKGSFKARFQIQELKKQMKKFLIYIKTHDYIKDLGCTSCSSVVNKSACHSKVDGILVNPIHTLQKNMHSFENYTYSKRHMVRTYASSISQTDHGLANGTYCIILS